MSLSVRHKVTYIVYVKDSPFHILPMNLHNIPASVNFSPHIHISPDRGRASIRLVIFPVVQINFELLVAVFWV